MIAHSQQQNTLNYNYLETQNQLQFTQENQSSSLIQSPIYISQRQSNYLEYETYVSRKLTKMIRNGDVRIRLNEPINEWKYVCKYVDQYGHECENYQIYECYCKHHQSTNQQTLLQRQISHQNQSQKSILRNQLDYIEYEVIIKGETVKMRKRNNDRIRFNRKLNEWKPVCKCIIPHECENYQTYNGYCRKHQSIIQVDPNIPRYFEITCEVGQMKFMEYQNDIWKFSKENGKYQSTCKFIFEDEEYQTSDRCVNYSFECGYCKKHKDGICNDRKKTTSIGDQNEEFISNLLKSRLEFIKVKTIGRENSELDIIYKIRDEFNSGIDQFRGIQIKTLTKIGNYNHYNMSNVDKYSDNTLIVGVSNNKSKFCLFFGKEINDGIVGEFINFDNPTMNQRSRIFYSFDDNSLGYIFIDMLIYYSKYSTLYSESKIYVDVLNERESISKLERYCLTYNVKFEHESSSDSSIDCKINDKNIQCKYSNTVNDSLYCYSLHKYKNNIRLPYDDRDNLDFFIFENGIGDFYVIPVNVMIYFGYIRNRNNKGKLYIMLSPSNSNGFHWSKCFINAFHLLFSLETFDVRFVLDMTQVVNIFNYYCYLSGIDSNRNSSNLSTKLCEIETIHGKKIVKLYESTKIVGNNYSFTIKTKIPYNIEIDADIPDFFVFYIKENNGYMYIFPKHTLIDYQLIGSSIIKGCTDLNLPIPGASTIRPNKFWTQQYVNRFDLLKLFEYSEDS